MFTIWKKAFFCLGCITLIDICNNFSISPTELLSDALNLNYNDELTMNSNILTESTQRDYSKLSNEDKKLVQDLMSHTIKLLLNKK